MWSPEFTAWIQDQRLSWITLYGAKWAKHSSWDAYSAAHAPDRVDFKSVYSCVRNHSLLKEGNVLVNPPNSNANMLLSAYSYFDQRCSRKVFAMRSQIIWVIPYKIYQILKKVKVCDISYILFCGTVSREWMTKLQRIYIQLPTWPCSLVEYAWDLDVRQG